MTSTVNQIEVISTPIDLKDYQQIVADIAELIYRTAYDAELSAQARNKKDTLLPPPMRTFLQEGKNYAS